ncbi:MAG: hypothetical protein K5864_04970 [Bacteroidales bacterium]|nr:hypothetical protein [Bacteroidales bacterium]
MSIKRISVLVLIVLAITGCDNIQNFKTENITKNTSLLKTDSVEDVNMETKEKEIYLLTENGVDILQLNKPLIMNPQKNSVYDSVKKNGDWYELFKEGKIIAYVGVYDVVTRIYIVGQNIVTKNGIHVGMKMRDCLELKDVTCSIGYNYEFGEPYICTWYKTMAIENAMRFSDEGFAKWNRMIEEVKKTHLRGEISDYSIELKPTDFQIKDSVRSIQLCWCSSPYPFGICELNGTDPNALEVLLQRNYYND